MRRGLGFLLLVLLVGAVIGTLIGEILGQVISSGPIHALVSRGVTAGISTFTIDLLAFQLTLGLLVKLNLSTVAGVALAFLWLRRK